jgi:hypothetical protein
MVKTKKQAELKNSFWDTEGQDSIEIMKESSCPPRIILLAQRRVRLAEGSQTGSSFSYTSPRYIYSIWIYNNNTYHAK